MTYSNFNSRSMNCGGGWTTETTGMDSSFIRISVPDRKTLRVDYDADKNCVEFDLDTETDNYMVLSRGAVYRLQYTQRTGTDTEGNEFYDGWKWRIQFLRDGKYQNVFDFANSGDNVSFEFNSEWLLCNNQMWQRGN